MDQTYIDGLLERHLLLLNEYTQLRRHLSSLQTQIFQDIARSNFSAERGMRYGQDHYDARMQAARRVRIQATASEKIPSFHVYQGGVEASVKADGGLDAQVGAEEDHSSRKEEGETEKEGKTAADETNEQGQERGEEKEAASQRQPAVAKKGSLDPLRWFGFFTPQPLRTAQMQSVAAVEHTIPRLASVNAELLHVEIEIRRARKKRSKAETVAERSSAR